MVLHLVGTVGGCARGQCCSRRVLGSGRGGCRGMLVSWLCMLVPGSLPGGLFPLVALLLTGVAVGAWCGSAAAAWVASKCVVVGGSQGVVGTAVSREEVGGLVGRLAVLGCSPKPFEGCIGGEGGALVVCCGAGGVSQRWGLVNSRPRMSRIPRGRGCLPLELSGCDGYGHALWSPFLLCSNPGREPWRLWRRGRWLVHLHLLWLRRCSGGRRGRLRGSVVAHLLLRGWLGGGGGRASLGLGCRGGWCIPQVGMSTAKRTASEGGCMFAEALQLPGVLSLCCGQKLDSLEVKHLFNVRGSKDE